jgi:hypothetical protein
MNQYFLSNWNTRYEIDPSLLLVEGVKSREATENENESSVASLQGKVSRKDDEPCSSSLTHPPHGLLFMGHDNDEIKPCPRIPKEVLFAWIDSLDLCTLQPIFDSSFVFTAYIDAFEWMDILTQLQKVFNPSNQDQAVLAMPNIVLDSIYRRLVFLMPNQAFDVVLQLLDQMMISLLQSKAVERAALASIKARYLDYVCSIMSSIGYSLTAGELSDAMKPILQVSLYAGKMTAAASLLSHWEQYDALLQLLRRLQSCHLFLLGMDITDHSSANVSPRYAVTSSIVATESLHVVNGRFLQASRSHSSKATQSLADLRGMQLMQLFRMTLVALSLRHHKQLIVKMMDMRPSSLSFLEIETMLRKAWTIELKDSSSQELGSFLEDIRIIYKLRQNSSLSI